MNIYEFDVMKFLRSEGYTSQRRISEATNYSLGKVNDALQNLVDKKYLNSDYSLTEKAHNEFRIKKPKNAIILAAGSGTRMMPINSEVPKGLIEIHGQTLIERLILQLHEVGIREIDIVVGFLKEKFEFLIDKYNVNLVYNPDYALKNNIHSLRLVVDKLSNTYILPCDVWSEDNPFSEYELYPWYSITDIVDDNSTIRINRQRELVPVKDGKSGNTMIGIAFLTTEESKILKENILKLTADPKYDDSFWEEALFNQDMKRPIYGKVFSSDKVFEINTYEQLRELDETSSSLSSSIISLIANEMKVKTTDIKDIVVLKKGMTNRSFRFTVNNQKYIMRIPGEGTENLINRKNEYLVYKTIEGKNLCDDVIYICPDKGYKITKYIDNARCCDPYNLEDVKMCMSKLKDLHNMKLQVPHTFDLYEMIDFYESLWGGVPSIFRDYQETKAKVFELRKIIDSVPKEWVLTHIDSVPDNFLITDKDIRLIDWEYASMQDPHVDIAMFAIYAMYDREHVDLLIDAYFTEGCPDEIRMKIYCYIATCGLLWSNWCEYKRLLGVEFGEYSLRQYRYAKEYYSIVMNEFVGKKEMTCNYETI